jgi:acyl-CoA thioesterase YciA
MTKLNQDRKSDKFFSTPTSSDGILITKTLAMPGDTNPNGDIFGGWVLSQMDMAGGILSKKVGKNRTVTVAIDSMSFLRPVKIGDVLCCFGEVIKTGRTSISIKLQAFVDRDFNAPLILVTEGIFVYVAIDAEGNSTPLIS